MGGDDNWIVSSSSSSSSVVASRDHNHLGYETVQPHLNADLLRKVQELLRVPNFSLRPPYVLNWHVDYSRKYVSEIISLNHKITSDTYRMSAFSAQELTLAASVSFLAVSESNFPALTLYSRTFPCISLFLSFRVWISKAFPFKVSFKDSIVLLWWRSAVFFSFLWLRSAVFF